MGFLTYRKILYQTDGFISPSQGSHARILSPLKIHRSGPDLNPQTLGSMAKTITITPPRTTDASLSTNTLRWMALSIVKENGCEIPTATMR
jgi:hypothetical protein